MPTRLSQYAIKSVSPAMPKFNLRPGLRKPVVLFISRRQVEAHDIAGVLDSLKIFSATREDTWLYRNQVSVVVDGYNEDPRELVNIPEVRRLLKSLVQEWRPWAFFVSLVDSSLSLLLLCYCGINFPRNGAAEIGSERLAQFLALGLQSMNEVFDKHGFAESELEAMTADFCESLELNF